MKINKQQLFLAVILFFAGCFSAQAQGLFVRVGGGYNLPLVGDRMGLQQSTNVTSTFSTSTSEIVYGNYGQSLNFGLRVGYMFSEHLGADLGLNYHLGSEIKIEDNAVQEIGMSKTVKNDVATASANAFIMTPSFILSLSQENKIVPYVRVGLAIGIPSLSATTSSVTTATTPGNNTVMDVQNEYKITSKVGLGMTGGVGVDIHLGDKFGVYGELNFLSMRMRPSEQEVTKFTINGADRLAQMTTSEKKITFVDKKEIKSTDPARSDAEPREEFGETINYNFVGVNVGIKFRF